MSARAPRRPTMPVLQLQHEQGSEYTSVTIKSTANYREKVTAWVETSTCSHVRPEQAQGVACGCGWPHADRHASHVYSGSQTCTIQNIKVRVLTSQKEHDSPMRGSVPDTIAKYFDTRPSTKSGISQAERASEMPRPEVPSLAPCGGPPSDSNVTTMMSNDMSAVGRYSIVCCGSEAAPSLITRLPEHAHAVCWPGLGVRDSLPWSPSRYFARAGYRVHLCSSCGGSQGPVTSLHA